MNPSRKILSSLNRDAVGLRLDVKGRQLRAAMLNGIPASWYPVIKEMCDEAGEPCPMSAFNWKNFNKSTPEQTAPHNEGAEL